MIITALKFRWSNMMLSNGMLCVCALIVLTVLPFADCQVCTSISMVMQWMKITYRQTYRESYWGNCFFRCRKYRTNFYLAERQVPRHVPQTVKTCCDGYLQVDSDANEIQCEPICRPTCKNGYCASPGRCACRDGYKLQGYECFSICDKGCGHGSCVEPNTCKCDYGYEFKNSTCQPFCTEPCVNSTCIAPDTCQCLDGYRKMENNLCLPYCSSGCEHGSCVSPENCTCDNGYKEKADVCVPHCDIDCGGGVCVEPQVCVCSLGYEKSEDGTCIPHCSKGCLHGRCVAPDNCACGSGWQKNTDDKCIPVCDIYCGEGGTCLSPNFCECKKGYIKTENGTCVPGCSNGCLHGTCVAPENCTCDDGWSNDINNDTCLPVCDFDCGQGGSCSSPNVCECGPKYETTENGTCTPHCSKSCPNGTCVSPDVCKCNEGWMKNEFGDCEPQCTKQCGNGTCIAPDLCDCFDGYKIDADNLLDFFYESLCIPECRNCNGTCVAPNKCVCETPLEAKWVDADDKDCDCTANCSEIDKRCDHIVCITKDEDISITTDTPIFSSTDSLATAVYKYSIFFGENDGVYSSASLENTDIINISSTDTYESDSLQNNSKSNWSQYWIYIVVTGIVILLVMLTLVGIFVKRKALSHFCTGGAYRIEDEKSVDLSYSIQTDLTYSNTLEKEQEHSLI